MAQTTSSLPLLKRGRPFRPGESGNPSGRPHEVGALAVLQGGAPRVAKKMVALALGGDVNAARLVLECGLVADPAQVSGL